MRNKNLVLMKIATLLIVFNLLSILPQGKETKLQSDISDVTVYTSSASITIDPKVMQNPRLVRR